jgi:hypothetical protein
MFSFIALLSIFSVAVGLKIGSRSSVTKCAPLFSTNIARRFGEDWKMFDPISNELLFPLKPFINALRPQEEIMKPLAPLMSADFTETDNEYKIHGQYLFIISKIFI